MSTPISLCAVHKAALGGEESLKWLIEAMKYNLTRPAYSMSGCRHNPPCPEASPEQIQKLNAIVSEALKAAGQNKNP